MKQILMIEVRPRGGIGQPHARRTAQRALDSQPKKRHRATTSSYRAEPSRRALRERLLLNNPLSQTEYPSDVIHRNVSF